MKLISFKNIDFAQVVGKKRQNSTIEIWLAPPLKLKLTHNEEFDKACDYIVRLIKWGRES